MRIHTSSVSYSNQSFCTAIMDSSDKVEAVLIDEELHVEEHLKSRDDDYSDEEDDLRESWLSTKYRSVWLRGSTPLACRTAMCCGITRRSRRSNTLYQGTCCDPYRTSACLRAARPSCNVLEGGMRGQYVSNSALTLIAYHVRYHYGCSKILPARASEEEPSDVDCRRNPTRIFSIPFAKPNANIICSKVDGPHLSHLIIFFILTGLINTNSVYPQCMGLVRMSNPRQSGSKISRDVERLTSYEKGPWWGLPNGMQWSSLIPPDVGKCFVCWRMGQKGCD